MRVQKSKGARDLSPAEMRRFRAIEGVFQDVCSRWGYGEVRTPTIEYLHLFTSTGTLTPGALSRVYSFLDWDGWSGERVVLRPDGTIPVARMYIDSLAEQKPARLFYVTSIFSFEETGKENRERWQCGAELIGVGSTAADAELVTIATAALRQAGLDNVSIKLSHAGVIRALLGGFGLSIEEQGKAFDQILDGDVAVLARLKDQTPELVRLLTPLLDLKGESSGFLKNLKAVFDHSLPDFTPALDNFIGVANLLTATGLKYEIDIASGRGFEYYTGLIFQLFIDGVKVGGGGRYDALIPLMGGANVPASGFALYMDPLMGVIQSPEDMTPTRVLVRAEGKNVAAKAAALKAVQRLHEAGLTAVLDSGKDGTDKYRWVLSLGSKGRVRLVNVAKDNAIDLSSVDAAVKRLGRRYAR